MMSVSFSLLQLDTGKSLQFGPVPSKAAANVCVQVLVWRRVFTSPGQIANGGIAGSWDKCKLDFVGSCLALFQLLILFYSPINTGRFFHILSNTWC